MANNPNLEPIINLINDCFMDEGIFDQFIIGSFSCIKNKLKNGDSLAEKISYFVLHVHTYRDISTLLDKIRERNPKLYEEHRSKNIDFFEEYESQVVKNTYRETNAINELEQHLQSLSVNSLKPIYQSCRINKADKIVDNLKEILNELNCIPSSNKTHRHLITFVLQVKEKFSRVAQNLENWLSEYGTLFGYNKNIIVSRSISSQPLHLSESSLLIAIERPKFDCFKIQAWFWSPQLCRCIQEPDIIMIDDNLLDKHQELSNKLNELRKTSNLLMKNIGSEDLRIEIFMPIKLLKELKKDDFCIEGIKIKLFDDETVEIGKQYPVIFRLAERRQPSYQDLKGELKRRWENLTSSSIIDYNRSNIHSTTIGVILDSINNYENFLKDIFSKAVPIALWSRCDLITKSSLDEIKRIINSPTVVQDFQQLPREIKNERNAALAGTEHIGHYICLLWDDPERMPPDPQTPENALMAI